MVKTVARISFICLCVFTLQFLNLDRNCHFAMSPIIAFAEDIGFSVPGSDAVISRESEGNDVKWLQSSLNVISGASLDVDGIFGEKTEAALKEFQSGQGLAITGIADKETIDRIQQCLAPAEETQKVSSESTSIVTSESTHSTIAETVKAFYHNHKTVIFVLIGIVAVILVLRHFRRNRTAQIRPQPQHEQQANERWEQTERTYRSSSSPEKRKESEGAQNDQREQPGAARQTATESRALYSEERPESNPQTAKYVLSEDQVRSVLDAAFSKMDLPSIKYSAGAEKEHPKYQ